MSDIGKVTGFSVFDKVSSMPTSSIKTILNMMVSSSYYGDFSYYIDGVLIESTTSSAINARNTEMEIQEPSITNPVAPNQLFIGIDQISANTYPAIYRVDNLIISSDVTRDLYTLRDTTTKPAGDDIVLYWGLNSNEESTPSVVFSGNDYAVGSPALSKWGMLSLGVDSSISKVGNGSGYIYHSDSLDDSWTSGIILSGLTNLPLKGRVGFWVRLGELEDNRYYENPLMVGLGTGFSSSGVGSTSSFIGTIFRGSEEGSPFFCESLVLSKDPDSVYSSSWCFDDLGEHTLLAGTWYFIEYVYDITGA